MINYENYTYNEECVFKKQCRKDRLEKQLGDFGEQLVMTLLGRVARYSVALVDHEGADLIATDEEYTRRFAISVKSAQIGPDENETKVFKKKDQEKLCMFAREFGLIPTVAMLFIPKDFAFIDVYLVTLDGFIKLAGKNGDNIEREAVKFTAKGIQINNFSLGSGKKALKHSDKNGYLKYLHSNELIEHIRLDVRNRDNFRKGIPQVLEDKPFDIKCIDELVKEKSFIDGNLPRQLGEAGEYLLMMFLGQQKKYRVARVDHVGADLIATDGQKNRYAISVKTTQKGSYEFYELYENGKSVKSPKNELGKLQEFAAKYKMVPVVACIFVKDSFLGMDIYISTLENWIKKAFIYNNKTICFNLYDMNEDIDSFIDMQTLLKKIRIFKINASNQKHRDFLNNTEGIEHMEINFLNVLNPTMKWK